MSDIINGWSPPIFTDPHTGLMRIATQDDIDGMAETIKQRPRMWDVMNGGWRIATPNDVQKMTDLIEAFDAFTKTAEVALDGLKLQRKQLTPD